ncbi:GNAT family N-acetyltransferase [Hyunsoonleella ulvae]|uniref:GNAT family N-acetyltransferase n=1 Tax=Hyunsoonleella ulvae TaxID=2799948 RepID=UPI00193AAB12|nr:GNAT family N-acetyltransferase [Hyunsoonleella ulvae]
MSKRLSLFLDFFFKENPNIRCIKRVTNTLANHGLITIPKKKVAFKAHSTFSIYDIPNYLKLDTEKNPNNTRVLKAPLYNGFLINLQKYHSLDFYLSKKLGRGRKSQLKRYKKRLDLCINPNYKVFFGEITRLEYDTLFMILKELIVKRFNQKKEINFELPYLEVYHKIMFALIHNKEAAIFAIYHQNKPICITLNFIYQHTVFHWNSVYDTAYDMFNIGHVNMLNHLNWSFENNIRVFDMGRGDFNHKRKYIDTKYEYEEHFFCHSKGPISKLKVYIGYSKAYLKYYLIILLKKINFHKLYGIYSKLKFRISNKSNRLKKKNTYKYQLLDKIPKPEYLTEIDYFNLDSNLTRTVNKFIFDKRQKVINTIIYSYSKSSYTYFLKSGKFNAKIERET